MRVEVFRAQELVAGFSQALEACGRCVTTNQWAVAITLSVTVTSFALILTARLQRPDSVAKPDCLASSWGPDCHRSHGSDSQRRRAFFRRLLVGIWAACGSIPTQLSVMLREQAFLDVFELKRAQWIGESLSKLALHGHNSFSSPHCCPDFVCQRVIDSLRQCRHEPRVRPQ